MSLAIPSFTRLAFTIVDVFTETPFKGNPLAIVSLPPPNEFTPSQAQLQSITTEFNLSEIIFLESVTTEDTKSSIQRARIFTTTREILFAGHPTIGAAAHLLIHNKANVQNLVPGAGPIKISTLSSKPGYVSAKIPHSYHNHDLSCPASRLLALHSELSPFISHDRTFPVVSIVHGMTFVLVELSNLKALAAARLGNASANIMANSGILDKGREYDAPICVYLYVRNAEAEQDGVKVVRTRMLVRGMEDPATGSAASTLTSYLTIREADRSGANRQWKIVQGVEMGRRSEIGVEVTLKEGNVDVVELSGTAVVVSEGTVRVYDEQYSPGTQ